jgi:hypothetical protein
VIDDEDMGLMMVAREWTQAALRGVGYVGGKVMIFRCKGRDKRPVSVKLERAEGNKRGSQGNLESQHKLYGFTYIETLCS